LLRLLRLFHGTRPHGSKDAPGRRDARPHVTLCSSESHPGSNARLRPVSFMARLSVALHQPFTLLLVEVACTAPHCALQPHGMRCPDGPDNSRIEAGSGRQQDQLLQQERTVSSLLVSASLAQNRKPAPVPSLAVAGAIRSDYAEPSITFPM